ncbi:asparaginyl-tRNA synthetase [Macrolepiota fuliginosa MF-IS2]|uniref:asparagine--tRNA ligase n=1 Tax=Macrolepiota fuliginosa MF-IS2 TaxID=1400762 RepID=A0A9P6C463_9AGAR|nr:asparaginyl-tRNA synthetase [Macrolepiota fuliginosa MF-IS2]
MFRRLYSTAAHPARFQLPQTIRQLLSSNGQENTTASVTGWIKSIRKQKNITFAVVSDGTTAEGLQAVVLKKQGTSPELLKRLTNGAAVRLTGNLIKSPGSGQDWELVIQEGDTNAIEVLGDCDVDTYPIQKKTLSTEYLRDNAYLRARTGQIAAMLRLRDHIFHNLSRSFESQGFTYTHTPIITGNDCEGAGEAFRIAPLQPNADANPNTTPLEFFSRPAYLTVSHQLHLESLTTALSRVYTLSPCFRAERSMTGRHLAEFWMLEAEWNLATRFDSIEEICVFVEGVIRRSIDPNSDDIIKLWEEKDGGKGLESEDYKTFRAAFDSEKPWKRMTYTEAIELLHAEYAQGHKFEFKPVWGESLSSEHERWLAEVHVGGPVFVTNYPIGLKPFYMRVNEDGKTVACFDLLVPRAGELVGGSVREERWDVLTTRMREFALLPSSEGAEQQSEGAVEGERSTSGSTYQWYADLRRYGGAPHGGFGLGFERLVSWVGGIDNVRECIGMPRWTGRMIM